jgi:hypothetical protein
VPSTYVVVQGDYLATIAQAFGFADYRTIWDDPGNQALRASGRTPDLVYPGDTVTIPDRLMGQATGATGRMHQFTAPEAKPVKLRLALRGADDRPLAGLACTVAAANVPAVQRTTDSNGQFEYDVAADVVRVLVSAPGHEWDVGIGHLDPVSELSGQRERLNNLGYQAGTSPDRDALPLRSAVEEFQCDQGLVVDGICGPATQKKLTDVYGC